MLKVNKIKTADPEVSESCEWDIEGCVKKEEASNMEYVSFGPSGYSMYYGDRYIKEQLISIPDAPIERGKKKSDELELYLKEKICEFVDSVWDRDTDLL